MDISVIDEKGGRASNVQTSDVIFGRAYNEALVHQLVVAFQANARSASSVQKGRSDVNKSTRKPWRQKGTGHARAGMASSPLWRGGGRIFPNTGCENYSQKINKKMYRAGLATILSQLVREDRLHVVEDFKLDTPKTKDFANKVKSLGVERVMLVADEVDQNLYLASRNLVNVYVTDVAGLDPVNLIRFPRILFTKGALKKVEEVLV